MDIEFSKHAFEQIKRRKISKNKVIETIKTGKRQESFKNRTLYQQTFGTKTLEIATIKEEGSLIIITAYYLYENKLRS